MKCHCGSSNLVPSQTYLDMLYCLDCKDGILKNAALVVDSSLENVWCRCGCRSIVSYSAEEYQCTKCKYVGHIEDSEDLKRNPPQKLHDLVQQYGLGVKVRRNFANEDEYCEVIKLYKEYTSVYLCREYSSRYPSGSQTQVCGNESDHWGWTKI